MKKQSRVAVITRTKDRPTFLRRAIESIHGQTRKDFIHVIYNDGGDRDELESFIAGQPAHVRKRVYVIHGPGSNGMEDSLFNPAIRAVDSEYVTIHDDDDTWHVEFLERVIGKMETDGVDGVVVRTDKILERVDGSSISFIKREHYMADMKAVNLYRQCTENQMTAITFAYRRSVFDAIGGYDDNLAVCGDWDFGIRYLLHTDVAYLDPGFALANYHHREYSESAEGNTSGSKGDRFTYYTNYLLNKYLRLELQQGSLGVGYIMSQHRFNEGYLSRLTHRLLPSVLAKKLKGRAQR